MATPAAEPQIRVLIVDDDQDIAESLHDVLSEEGLAVTVAHDGLEALASLGSSPLPDVILLDLMMPRCDGATFLAHQRADPRLAPIPVVLLSASSTRATKVPALDVAATLQKPVGLDALLATVARVARPRGQAD